MSTKLLNSLFSFVAGLIFVASSAAASTLSLTYLGPASGYRSLVVTGAPVSPVGGGGLPAVVNAGGFRMQDPTFGSFVAWCLDLTHYVGVSGAQPYETTFTPFNSSYVLNSSAQSRLQSLFDANYYEGLENDRNLSAGFQMAAWNVIYDPAFDLTSGMFQGHGYGSVDVAAFTAAQDFLKNASVYTGEKAWRLTYLESLNGNQNLLTVTAVPLPAAGLLLIGGIAGLGLAARRRRKAA